MNTWLKINVVQQQEPVPLRAKPVLATLFGVFVLLIAARLCGVNLSWWVVTVPLWIIPVAAVVVLGGFVLLAWLAGLMVGRHES